jgi:hypothetical protein
MGSIEDKGLDTLIILVWTGTVFLVGMMSCIGGVRLIGLFSSNNSVTVCFEPPIS